MFDLFRGRSAFASNWRMPGWSAVRFRAMTSGYFGRKTRIYAQFGIRELWAAEARARGAPSWVSEKPISAF
jgi:hypothetical protein